MAGASAALPWSAAWRIARRDLSARFKGLRLLLVCLFLGVGALAAIGTLTGAIEHELSSRGREILGGDVQLAVWQREATADELAAFSVLGKVSGGKRLQAMAVAGDAAAPIELKSVDEAWPLYGQMTLKDGRRVGAPPPGAAWLGEGAAARLGIGLGDSFTIGSARLRLAGIVGSEPDRLGEGFTLGPVAIVRAELPAEAGLLLPGAMYRSKYRIAFAAPRDAEAVSTALQKRFPAAGFEVRTRDNASPGAERFISRLGQFLVLVGLEALAIAGIGIGGGVSSWLEARRGSIATLKVLGATSGDIARITLLQIMAAALIGTLAGLTAGVMITPLLAHALSGLLPVEGGFRIDPAALLRAAAYGLLVALVFTAPPLARARAFPAMALLRARVSPTGSAARHAALPVGLGLAAIIALAMFSAAQPLVTAGFLAGAAVMLALLAGLGWLLRRGFARLPRPANPLLRAALANLHRPGAQTGALVTALGFGLTTFVLLAAVESSLDANIARRVPARAPDYFVMDVPKDRLAEFDAAVHSAAPQARLRTVPALRGAILAYGPPNAMIRVADMKAIPDDAWPLRGERGLTYADELPEGNTLTAGTWWPRAYAGPPLVSIDEKLAQVLGLHLGDRLNIGLLGVERSATIASFRRIDWDSMGFNYVLVFSPNAIADAPHNLAATIDLPSGSASGDLLRRLTRAFPSSSVIETGPLLRDARNLLGQMSLAILAAASVAVLAGIAVLLGAIAAARASRSYDTVILRVLGASRRQLLLIQIGEYGILALLLGVVSLGLGSALAWGVIVQVFDFEWLPDWTQVLGVLGAGIALVLIFAFGASLPVLRTRPAQALREL
ncbi:MAG: FtsX-like permease family protein [Novosphingobium sp.]